MKRKKLFITTLIITISFAQIGCNKESLIEKWYTADYKKVMFSTPLLISATSVYKIDTIATNCFINFIIQKAKNTSAANGQLSINDSITYVGVVGSYSYIATKNNCVAAYNEGDTINNTVSTTTSTALGVFYRKYPYTSNSWATLSSYNGITANFQINRDAYLAFKFTNTASSKTYFGWILLQGSNLGVLIRGYAYKTYEAIKAGE